MLQNVIISNNDGCDFLSIKNSAMTINKIKIIDHKMVNYSNPFYAEVQLIKRTKVARKSLKTIPGITWKDSLKEYGMFCTCQVSLVSLLIEIVFTNDVCLQSCNNTTCICISIDLES